MGRILKVYKWSVLNKIVARILRPSLQRRYFRNFYLNISYPEARKGSVLIYAGIGYSYLAPLEIFLYHLLRKEGYEVQYCIYDESIPAHELLTHGVIHRQGRRKYLASTVKKARQWLKAAGVPYTHIQTTPMVSALVQPIETDLESILKFEYEGINFGKIVKGAMYRYYRSLSFGENATVCASNYLKTALTNYFYVKKLNEQNSYQFLLFSHGINCTWEPVAEYCWKNKVKFLCYDRAKRLASANFNINQQSPVWNFDDAWSRYESRTLTVSEEAWVDNHIGKRELHMGDVFAYNFSRRESDLTALRTKLNIQGDARVLTIFTNLIWDAANVSRDIAFASTLVCIEETLQRYGNDKRIHILLRPHPAEKVIGTDEGYAGLVIKNLKGALPGNYSVVDPILVNSFSVIDITDIGVVNTSTVGLELAMMGKPVILISDTHYRNKGFTSDAATPADYFSKIEFWLQNSGVGAQVSLARKYFYMMMNLYQKNTPLLVADNAFDGYSYNHFNDVTDRDEVRRVIQSASDPDTRDFVFWD